MLTTQRRASPVRLTPTGRRACNRGWKSQRSATKLPHLLKGTLSIKANASEPHYNRSSSSSSSCLRRRRFREKNCHRVNIPLFIYLFIYLFILCYFNRLFWSRRFYVISGICKSPNNNILTFPYILIQDKH